MIAFLLPAAAFDNPDFQIQASVDKRGRKVSWLWDRMLDWSTCARITCRDLTAELGRFVGADYELEEAG